MDVQEVKGGLQDLLQSAGYVAQTNEYLEKMPFVQKKRLSALKKLQLQSLEVEGRFYERVHQLEKEFEDQFNKLNEQRKKIVTGEYEPTEDESNLPIIHGLEESDIQELNSKSEPDTGLKGIPDFWLNVLRSTDIVMDTIREHDEPILKYLTDIKSSVQLEPPGYTLFFHFSENPFFKNTVLQKSYEMTMKPDEDDPFEFDGPSVVKSTGDTIEWNEGKNVTKKVVKKKQKKGANAGRFLTKTVKAESFFNFFEPPQQQEGNEEEEGDEHNDLIRMDFEMGQILRDNVIPRAVLFVTGEIDQEDDFDFEDGEDDEDDVSDEDEE